MMEHTGFGQLRVQPFLDSLHAVDHPERKAARLDEVASQLSDCGIGPGVPVLVVLPNGIAFAEIVFGLLTIGAVPVLLPSAAPASRVTRIANVIGADVIAAASLSTGLASEVTEVHRIGDGIRIARIARSGGRMYEAGQIILLTSGTSGIFSGCLFNADALLTNARRHAAAIGQRPGDTILINLPTYYSYAFVAQLLATCAIGGRAVIDGPPFTPSNYRSILADHAISLSSVTPVMVESWRRDGAVKLPPSLRCLTVGGAALNPASVGDILRHNPALELYLTYGLTECGPRVATLAAHNEPATRHASVGLPLPGVTVALDRADPLDDEGELIVQTETAMIGTVGRQGAAPVPLADGRRLIATRDIFTIDQDGYLYFRRRRSTVALIRGEKVDIPSVCRQTEQIAGVIRAEAWVQKGADGDDSFTLDVYCRDGSLTAGDIRRQLARVLLRGEQPTSLVLHHGIDPGWRKTEAVPEGKQ
ncbi:coronafacic acid synthetase, ligase component (plasmid) [Azospirillum sp. B510]|uniref:class I adenylate-forming enzyme family protein n=1 Tax=Azospirillum sp. (strain B510) TaxID=137722 RepID=UPI0001C4B94B|nr:class I adenylate-forming enzyme family protein [Azospirillum sp. B510]BAI73722.1 coronafacic acid synthetase, ligase component [Azospirillum sp. B510]